MKKRAQGLSINLIIVAAIALIVLVVLVAVFTGQFGDWVSKLRGTGDPSKPCSAQEGTTQLRDQCEEGEVQIASSDAAEKGKVCCKASS